MHDDRVNCIVFNAFNGFGDTTGSDEFGYSVAWIDLNDHLEPEGLDHYELYPYSDDISEYVKTFWLIAGRRWALAYWDTDGSRSVVGYDTKSDALDVFNSVEAEYLQWLETT